jgi:uncharacterized protein (DUF302 family)
MGYGRRVTLQMPYEAAVARVKDAFADEGFGTLTDIDVRATLREKLGEDVEGYRILGVCNPRLAHRALDVDRSVGLLLPCTVVVRASADAVLVEALDPDVMVTVPDDERLRPIADEARARIDAALEALSG